MILDLRDPASIVAWFKACPARHGPQLAQIAAMFPQFAEPLAEAGRSARAARAQAGGVK